MVLSARPVVYVLACCYNEARILPFFLDHYIKFVGASRVILLDGGSTDESAEIAARYPEVIFKVQRSEKLDDRDLLRIRNEEWKPYRSECDWMVVCDVDEFLYCPDPAARLRELKEAGVTLPSVEGFVMYSKTFPQHEPDRYLWQQVQTGVADPQYGNKNLIFDSRIDINYQIGCHNCAPTGPVVRSAGFAFKNLHYSMLSYDAVVGKSRMVAARLSDWNEKTGAGFHRKQNAVMPRSDFNRLFFKTSNVVEPVGPPVKVSPAMHVIARALLEADLEPHIRQLGAATGAEAGDSEKFYAWFVHTYGGRFAAGNEPGGTEGPPVDLLDLGSDGYTGEDGALQALRDFARLEPRLTERAVVVSDLAPGPNGFEGHLRYLAYYLIGRGFKAYAVGTATLFSRRDLTAA